MKNYVSDNYTVMRFSTYSGPPKAFDFIKTSRRVDNTFCVGDKVEYLHVSLYQPLIEVVAYVVYEIVESGIEMISGSWDYPIDDMSIEDLGFTREELGLEHRT